MIDVHVHLHPPRLGDAIRRHFTERGWPLPHPFDPASVAGTLKAHGVERFCFFSYAHRPGMARAVNEWIAGAARDLPGAVPLGTIHADDPDCVAVAEHALGVLGLGGFKIHCSVQRLAPDDGRLFPVYERVARAGKVLVLHAGTMPYGDPHTGARRVEAVMARFPELRVCVAHLGQFEVGEFAAMTERYPHLYLDTAMALTLLATPYVGAVPADVPTELLLRHQDRILFGSDFPLTPYPYEEELRWLETRRLPADVARKILATNAARWLGLSG